jgi:hypothetical protein
MNLKRIVLDNGARPDTIHQVVLGDQLAGCLRELGNDLERPAAQLHRHAA